MKWASAISTQFSLEAAVNEVVQLAQRSLAAPADLGLVFISSTFASEYPRLLPLLQQQLAVPNLIGCGGGGIIGLDSAGRPEEVEGEPALTLMLGHLPGVDIQTFDLEAEDLPDLDSSPDDWIDLIGVAPADHPQFILLADSFSSKIKDLLQGLDYAYPGSVKLGGLTSGSSFSGCGLFCDGQLYREGTVGVALSGNITVETIVAQGCRPIGQPYRIAESDKNVLLKLEQQVVSNPAASYSQNPELQTPLEALQELIQDLSEDDRLLAQDSLFVGIVRDEFKQSVEQGDFLIRNLIGVDPRIGAIAIGDRVRPGQRIQFHLRDADTSAEDLEMLLKRYRKSLPPQTASPTGALLFSCLGRGVGLYGEDNFDSELFNRYFHHVPLSGFFCHGEIGPVGSETFLHGYTSVFGIFRPS
ncbi:MAG: FIST C-terminal domain-containing protein [Aphanocapsa sp. GSE-SYN-MK-11-07L]|nr:FIST C-terminal domain-containing protein [Aphanocapsa sp. GSE-SYN-MK-11-07L]